MQAYLSRLDALKENFTTLMPFTKDAITYGEQQIKYFMTVALSRLPSELDFVKNQILSGSNVPNFEAVIEQLLRLVTLMLLDRFLPYHPMNHMLFLPTIMVGVDIVMVFVVTNAIVTVTLKLIVVQRQENNNNNHVSLLLLSRVIL